MPPDKWGYNEAEKMMCDVLIVDEFSMVDLRLFKHIIDAIDFKRTKLLMIGDNAQLPSVSCGNLLHDFMQSKMIPTVTLTRVALLQNTFEAYRRKIEGETKNDQYGD